VVNQLTDKETCTSVVSRRKGTGKQEETKVELATHRGSKRRPNHLGKKPTTRESANTKLREKRPKTAQSYKKLCPTQVAL